jgi:hypothetical protein
MYATGAISLLSQRMIGLPKSVGAAQIRILPPVALGSAFLNNTPLVAMMIPVVRDLARNTGLAASKLFMGLSFASILGGTMTLIGTSVNLIIAGLVADAMASGRLTGMKPLTIFEPIWVGLPAALAGLLFLMLIGPRLLPGDRRQGSVGSVKRVFRVELRVQPQANLDGKTLEAAGFAQPVGYSLLSVTRGGAAVETASTLKLSGGDVLAFAVPAGVLPGLWATIRSDSRVREQDFHGALQTSARRGGGIAKIPCRGTVDFGTSFTGQHLLRLPCGCIARRPRAEDPSR